MGAEADIERLVRQELRELDGGMSELQRKRLSLVRRLAKRDPKSAYVQAMRFNGSVGRLKGRTPKLEKALAALSTDRVHQIADQAQWREQVIGAANHYVYDHHFFTTLGVYRDLQAQHGDLYSSLQSIGLILGRNAGGELDIVKTKCHLWDDEFEMSSTIWRPRFRDEEGRLDREQEKYAGRLVKLKRKRQHFTAEAIDPSDLRSAGGFLQRYAGDLEIVPIYDENNEPLKRDRLLLYDSRPARNSVEYV
ncbi:MAG: hypothetical protein KKG59_07390 [Nanoarchaeota archaeon]|nr:hypothetical protein [Nanoarchaeota archaeon]